MEDVKEKLKKLTKFGQKATAVEFAGNMYFVVESGGLTSKEKCVGQKDYFLFDEKGHIGYLYLHQEQMDEFERKLQKHDGVIDTPDRYFMLSDIEILKLELRGKHLGDFLLNWAMLEMEKIIKESGQTIPISFLRQNSEVTIPFYKKWGAVINQEKNNDIIGSSCYMIIKQPKSKPEYTGNMIDTYEKTKEDRHR